ncbi:unnamed protein product [Aspergillus oryzae RIB40]|uniref:DNA, 47Q_0173 n=2 Tax=Aspergillus oryzae TaxID=5062 RepID=Q2UDW9_ASPOR|nr:uncharacterized protein AO090673000006 [Aspergillus oryzae RIB40]EIT81940.1 hypothetical protein Ao3042_01521 [Aspergillus oryzae 3.042]KDE85116.1 hypothetical protein AO1008_00466 [Aspergillus oryzae 100-8]BAE60246.1 unnamed protein product [Aspergillus oryzae RIB40]|eukprot:EIT81940.1 hypothetical protein Ao3042_01521 [Aspergillus oryzae 3.042]
MHMWPIPEKPKTPEPAPPPDPPVPEAAAAPEALPAPEDVAVAVPAEEPKKKSDSTGAKKPRTRAPDPGAFAMWMAGGNRLKLRSRWEVNAEHVNGFCMFCDIFRFLRQPGANARSLNLIYLSFSGGAWLFLSHSRDWFLMPQGGIARPNPFTFCFCF